MATRVYCDYKASEDDEHKATHAIHAQKREGSTVSSFKKKDSCLDHVGIQTQHMLSGVYKSVNFYNIVIQSLPEKY